MKIHVFTPAFRLALIAVIALGGAFAITPKASAASDIENACTMLKEKAAWYGGAKAAAQKWDVPMPAILAVIHQESRFKATAAAINSSAYGFAQVLDGTWNSYRKANEATTADRTSFADSADFIGWYMSRAEDRIGLPTDDVAAHYLVYHEGHVGYRSGRWEDKPGLLNVAEKVARLASRYEDQLRACNMIHHIEEEEQLPMQTALPKPKPFALEKVAAVLPVMKPSDRLVAAAFSGLGRSF